MAENKGEKFMTKLLFVRHGQSVANENGFFAGHTDVALTALGLRQAEELKAYLIKNYDIDCVYSSDLLRACQTVNPIANTLNLNIIKESGLREVYGGKWEGLSIEDIKNRYPDDYDRWKNDIGLSRPTGGESVEEVQKRGIQTLAKIAQEKEGKTVVICTHGCFLRAMQCFWQGANLSQMKDIEWVPNASVTEVIYGDKITVASVGKASFLSGITKLCEGM